MADAYCGPSNALQNFQKHTAVDRSLQQDRLTSRRTPLESFRSVEPNAGALDPEFEAFQASQPGPLPFAEPGLPFQQSLNQRGKQPAFGGGAGGVDWAADFRRLQVSPHPQQQHHASPLGQFRQSPAPQTSQASRQSPFQMAPSMAPQPFQAQYGGLSGFRSFQPSMMQQHSMGMQTAQAPMQQMAEFDDEAFARAFDAAREDILSQETAMDAVSDVQKFEPLPDPSPHLIILRLALTALLLNPTEQNMHKVSLLFSLLELHEPDQITPRQLRLFFPILDAFTEAKHIPYAARYNLYSRANIFRLLHTSKANITDEDIARTRKAESFYDRRFEAFKEKHQTPTATVSSAKDEELQDDISMQLANVMEFSHAGRVAQLLPADFSELMKPLSAEGFVDVEAEFAAENIQLPAQVDQARLQALDPLQRLFTYADQRSWNLDRSAATSLEPGLMQQYSYLQNMDEPMAEQMQPEVEELKEEQLRHDENDELARTASELLDKVQDNRSEKFQNSAFLTLMRRLRDHEVKVDGDKMIETGTVSESVGTIPTTTGPALQTQQGGIASTISAGYTQRVPINQSASFHQTPSSNDVPHQAMRDGEDVVRLLDEPGTLDQDPEFTMTTPFLPDGAGDEFVR